MNKPRLPGFHPGFPGQQMCDLRNVTNLSGSQFPYLHNAVGVQSPSPVRLFATPWTAARQASLSLTISWSLYKFMSIESVMQSNPLILCCPLLLLPSIFPSTRVFSNELVHSIVQESVIKTIPKKKKFNKAKWFS